MTDGTRRFVFTVRRPRPVVPAVPRVPAADLWGRVRLDSLAAPFTMAGVPLGEADRARLGEILPKLNSDELEWLMLALMRVASAVNRRA